MAQIDDVLKEPEPGWNRIDDTNPDITYIGGKWVPRSAMYYYNNTFTNRTGAADNQPGTVRFLFKGTGIRIIAPRYQSARKDVKVEIDGVLRGTYKGVDQRINGAKYQLLAHQTLGLEDKIHEIKLTVTGGDLAVDAFDIFGGTIIHEVKVGDILLQPEPGWQRFDDTDISFQYSGAWGLKNSTECYGGSTHYCPGSTDFVTIQFQFYGTSIRIIGLASNSYDIGYITIDNQLQETFSYKRDDKQYQTLVYEKLNLTRGVHTVVLSGNNINFDALDIDDTGKLIPIKPKKPKESLYEKESGKLFVDDFDSVNPNWLMSPSNVFNNAIKKGFLRMNHSADKDVMLLIDKPQSNFAIQVIADYAPTKEGDQGGLLIYQNEKNKVEFLESYSANSSQSNKEWMAICKEDQWDFYTKTDTFFDYADNDSLAVKRIGVVLKGGTAEGFAPLDINKIIMTTSNMLRLRQLYENYKVVLKDTADNTLSTNIVATAHTGIDILLPSLEFEGIIEIYDEENELIANKQATFYGGDMYCMGSSLQIKMNGEELNTTDPTNLGYMLNNERIVKMTIVNDTIGAATDIKLSIQQYMEKVGYTWALISLDGTNYSNEIQIDSVAAQDTRDFWVKVVKDTNFLTSEPVYFNIHLKHN
ncbi:hypothetical protein SAMN05878494_1375 [Bacillus cereus]|nr:hypothetical protein SAMN05878494_1375 [Bacillus cereus]